jgi:hypothetical protein
MGQRKLPTKAQIAAAQEKYAADVAARRRIPLPDFGQLREPDGDWRPVAGDHFEIITPRRAPAPRRSINVSFNALTWRVG